MAQRVTTTLVDDLDGGDASETIRFGLDGKSYENDLNKNNVDKLRKALAPFIEAGRGSRGTAGAPRGGSARRTSATGTDPKAVRAWAAANGVPVPSRGRMPASVLEQFRAAGN